MQEFIAAHQLFVPCAASFTHLCNTAIFSLPVTLPTSSHLQAPKE